MNKIIDMSEINWNEIDKFALSSLMKQVCEYKRDNPNIFANDIGKIYSISKSATISYLKKGSQIWEWCNYNPIEERKRGYKNLIKQRIIFVFKTTYIILSILMVFKVNLKDFPNLCRIVYNGVIVMKSWKDVLFLIVMFLILVLCVGGCCYGCRGCSSSDSSDTTKSSFYKRQRGEELNSKEKKELESYDKWKEKQEDKDK